MEDINKNTEKGYFLIKVTGILKLIKNIEDCISKFYFQYKL